MIQSLHSFLINGQIASLGMGAYLLLAVLVAVEGPVATLLGAAAASAGLLHPELVFIAAATGNLSADSLWYTLGYAGKLEWIDRLGRKIGFRAEMLERLKHGMQQHAARILFVAKLTVSFMIPSLITAGLVKVHWKRWFPALFAGETIWTGSLVLLGYYASRAIGRIESGLEYTILGLSLIFILYIFSMLWRVLQTH